MDTRTVQVQLMTLTTGRSRGCKLASLHKSLLAQTRSPTGPQRQQRKRDRGTETEQSDRVLRKTMAPSELFEHESKATTAYEPPGKSILEQNLTLIECSTHLQSS